MDPHTLDGVGRRHFLAQGAAAAVALFGSRPVAGMPPQPEDAPNVHNMLVVGEQAVFLSHLPMFQRLNPEKSAFMSPHRYQVILEAKFGKGDEVVSDLYLKDRRAHPDTRIYTLGPQEFVLSRLFPSAAGEPAVKSFTATVFRGHLEQGGMPVPGLEETRVDVARVAHARQFDPRLPKPDRLEYILFGKPSELFLAHAIFGPPDFDHVVGAKVLDGALTDKDLATDTRIVFADRKNAAAERLREGQQVAATLRRGGDKDAGDLKLQVQVGRQLYFEEGELLVPPTFEPTPEEKKSPA